MVLCLRLRHKHINSNERGLKFMATLTTNKNFLTTSGFKLSLDRLNYPNLEFFVQSVQHPNVTLPATDINYSRLGNISMPGDQLLYDEVTFMTIVDEDLNGYTEMHDWMKRIVEVNAIPASKRSGAVVPTSCDISLQILNSHNLVAKTIRYQDAVPTNLGDLLMEATVGDTVFVISPMTFAYSNFCVV